MPQPLSGADGTKVPVFTVRVSHPRCGETDRLLTPSLVACSLPHVRLCSLHTRQGGGQRRPPRLPRRSRGPPGGKRPAPAADRGAAGAGRCPGDGERRSARGGRHGCRRFHGGLLEGAALGAHASQDERVSRLAEGGEGQLLGPGVLTPGASGLAGSGRRQWSHGSRGGQRSHPSRPGVAAATPGPPSVVRGRREHGGDSEGEGRAGRWKAVGLAGIGGEQDRGVGKGEWCGAARLVLSRPLRVCFQRLLAGCARSSLSRRGSITSLVPCDGRARPIRLIDGGERSDRLVFSAPSCSFAPRSFVSNALRVLTRSRTGSWLEGGAAGCGYLPDSCSAQYATRVGIASLRGIAPLALPFPLSLPKGPVVIRSIVSSYARVVSRVVDVVKVAPGSGSHPQESPARTRS